jgi:hypothetical protein
MHRRTSRRTDLHTLFLIFCIILSPGYFLGCGGGSGSGGGSTNVADKDTNDNPPDNAWQQVKVKQISASGLLLSHVTAKPDGNDQLHIAYFTDSLNTAGDYTVNHILWDMESQSEISHESVIDVDNCNTLSLALGPDNIPIVAYQGGVVREGGSEQQSDVMVSIMQNTIWTEYTGGIGFVARNPIFTDGLAGKFVSVAVDASGDIHLCYQFFYEGIDAMNFNYPDLLYVKKDGSSPSTDGTEETVEGNVYNSNGSASEQNRVGAYASMIIDSFGNPVIFYYADLSPNSSDPDTKGLRVAYRTGGVWQAEWVETGFEVGDISCALDSSGNLSVAYYVDSLYTDSHGITHQQCLKYATKTSSAWTTTLVDESTLCGKYCSLAFDASGNPAIAYYSMQNHSGSLDLKDLKLSSLEGTSWSSEVVASEGDIGNYNTLWFDGNGKTYICSYSNTDQAIYLFYR